MGLSKEEAYKILGVPNESSIYLARARYRKLANRYHPDKNPHRREYALKRFQRIVEAYVRLQIDPDDCDQMKMKMILAELYSMNEEILADEFKFSEDSDSDPDELILISSRHDSSVDYSSSPYDSQKGPYADVLQDFMIRSYMSGGRKSKPSVNIGTEKKSFVSERARERASQHANELLKVEEEERKKDEKRKQRNKKKKEAKKRKKCQKFQDVNGGRKVSPTQQQFVIEEDIDEDVDDEEEERDLEDIENGKNVSSSDDEHEWDMSSAFFAHITAKLNEQSNTSPTATSSTSPASSVNGAGASVPETKNSDKPLPKVEEDKFKMTSQETDIFKPSKEEVVTAIPPPPEMAKVLQHPRYLGSNSYSGRNTYQCELPPRLAKKAQMNYSTRNGHTSDAPTSQVKTKSATVSTQSDINKEKKGKHASIQNGDKDHDLDQSRKLAVLGNNEAKEGRFQDAVHHFSEAIQLYPFDHRYFGNRSFCYEYMEDYKRALQDATDSLKLKPDWPKGFFRKAKALAGLKKYEEAEECFEKALKFDPTYVDAKDELKKIQVKRLVSMGFDEPISIIALRKCGNVQDAVDAIVSNKVPGIKLSNGDSKELHNGGGREDPPASMERYINDEPTDYFEKNIITTSSGLPPRLASLSVQNTCPTLWVGNVDPAIITEGMLLDAFKKCGTVEAIHILHDRFCAFVTFSKPQEASLALKQLQNQDVGGCFLLLRYPDNPSYSPSARKKKDLAKSGPVNGDECYFWRTTGCVFGSKCRFRHVTKNKGIDMSSVAHKVGKNSDGKKPQRFNY